MEQEISPIVVEIGAIGERYESLLDRLVSERVASRIFAGDANLWGPEAAAEAAIRLGWTDFLPAAERLIPEIESLRAKLSADGVDRIVLCGMGGSSLAPEVISRWAGVSLTIVDSTHPAVIERELGADLQRTAVVVSSKSGNTVETRSHRAAFAHAFEAAGLSPSERIIVVTDPGSALESDARAAGQRVFLADPNVGGRFSALTAFGLVPTGLAGADIRLLVDDAQEVRDGLTKDSPTNPALTNAAALAADLPERYLLAVASGSTADWGLGAWVEQLIAESTGKSGKGMLPYELSAAAPELRDRPANTLLVNLYGDTANPMYRDDSGEAAITATLGAHFLLWEVVTAALGWLMEIDPFNQPDVEAAKIAAREALASASEHAESTIEVPELAGATILSPLAGAAPVGASGIIEHIQEIVPENGYLSIQAYLDASGPHAATLARLRSLLVERLGIPVTIGWGPRYLHSVGQLHKGGPELGAFLQISDLAAPDVEIPGMEQGFQALISAQARGDREVLIERGRPVLALRFEDPEVALREIVAAV